MSEDENYNDDFSDSENQHRNDDDEQHTQKVNGKIDALTLRVDELQRELAQERKSHEESKRAFQVELRTAKQASKESDMMASSEDANNELATYKALCAKLKEKLDEALMFSDTEQCPSVLRAELYKYCKKHKIFPDVKEREITVAVGVQILHKVPVKTQTSAAVVNVNASGSEHLTERIKLLEEELRLALGAAEDIRALKAKLLQMMERTRQEKEAKIRAEIECQALKRKVEMLTDHMEKLMIHLKHEAAHKVRIAEQLRTADKDHTKLKEKYDLTASRSAAKDRLILELREGSKVLEDQLRLMDEKYLELRTKLDWARDLGSKKVKKAERVAADLRMKFALSGNSTLLDNIPLPDIYNSQYSGSQMNLGGSSIAFDDQNSWVSGMNSATKQGGGGRSRNQLSKSATLGKLNHSTTSALGDVRKSAPDMDVVLEKIRTQQGGKQEWTEEKLKKLARFPSGVYLRRETNGPGKYLEAVPYFRKEMKSKATKKSSTQLRHSPLGNDIEKPVGKLKPAKNTFRNEDEDDDEEEDEEVVPSKISSKISRQADAQRSELQQDSRVKHSMTAHDSDESEDDLDEASVGEDGDVALDGEYVDGVDLSQAEEAVVSKFLSGRRDEGRSLADIIMEKLKEREEGGAAEEVVMEESSPDMIQIPDKVVEVYTAVGKLLAHYKSGKLPKALKMLPHLKNWEHILWLTRPDEWSPAATYAATRIFASNLKERMAQRFMNLVLLEKCRDDIRINNKLNYHLYLALKKSLFKPAAFYKGLLLPLAQSGNCTLREALIIGSVLAKVSIPGNHSAAVILRLAEMPYSGSTSSFIKVLLNKKYALPRRVIEALVVHFCNFTEETRTLPVIWHQSLLVFAQRYKLELNDSQKERLKQLLRFQQHHQITSEVRRELFSATAAARDGNDDASMTL